LANSGCNSSTPSPSTSSPSPRTPRWSVAAGASATAPLAATKRVVWHILAGFMGTDTQIPSHDTTKGYGDGLSRFMGMATRRLSGRC
jgi:hypothetical protein